VDIHSPNWRSLESGASASLAVIPRGLPRTSSAVSSATHRCCRRCHRGSRLDLLGKPERNSIWPCNRRSHIPKVRRQHLLAILTSPDSEFGQRARSVLPVTGKCRIKHLLPTSIDSCQRDSIEETASWNPISPSHQSNIRNSRSSIGTPRPWPPCTRYDDLVAASNTPRHFP